MRTQARRMKLLTGVVIHSGLVAIVTLSAQLAHAQLTSADTFDINRFSNSGAGWFETFYVEETQSLQTALDDAIVSADSAVLITETAGGQLALLTDQMAFHHIAEGTVNGKDWMATF